MTRSLFDPTGDDMLQEGDRFTSPSGANQSHMPPSAIDGKVGDEPDVKVPLKGAKGEEGLDEAATEELAEAAAEAVQEDNNPDGEPSARNPGEERPSDEDDLRGVEDI
jgi:hypothetical protein